jgi:hypothetical protein
VARKISVDIIGRSKSLEKAFDRSSKSANGFGKSMAKAGKMASIGLGVGLAGAAVVLKKSVDAALEAEKAQTRLDSAFKATTASAKERAASMERVNVVSQQAALDDEALMDTLGRLTRVTGSTTKAQEGMAVAANLARGRGIELEAATKIVEKAYLGNVGALKRIGIEIPKVTTAQDALKESGKKATVEQMKAAKAADDTATRQSAIAALQKQYAGAAEAYGKTAAGASDRFKVAVENLQESLGNKLLPALAKVAGGAATFIEKFSKAKGLEAKVKVVLETGRDLLTNVAKIAVDIGKQLQTSLGQVNWNNAGVKIAAGIGDALRKGLPVAGQLAATLSVAFINAVNSVDWVKVGGAIASGMKKGAIDGVKNFARDPKQLAKVYSTVLLGVGVTKALSALANVQGERGGEAIGKGFEDGLGKRGPTINAKAKKVMQDAGQAALADAYGSGSEVGYQFGTGFGAGVAAASGWAAAQAEALVLKAYQRARKAAQSKSPSRLMMRLGADFTQGFIDGLKSKNAALSREMTSIMNALAAITERRAKQDRAAAVRDAIAALAEARKKKEGVVAAERNLARAREDIVVANLEKTMAREQAVYDRRQTLIQSKMDKLNAAIQKAQDKQAAIFDKIRGKVMTAFEAVRGGMRTPAEKALAELNENATQRDLQRALNDAIASGDADAILRAQEDIQRNSLEKQAATERTALDQQTDDLREKLGEKLEVWKGGTQGILTMLSEFGIDFANVGVLLGTAFRDSLVSAIGGGGAVTPAVASGGIAARSQAWNQAYQAQGLMPSSSVVNVYGDVTGTQLVETVRREINRIQKQNSRTGYV